jgi:two-component system response regulator HydG
VLPPLRERREDIPLLTRHFLDKYTRKMSRKVTPGDGVLDYLMEYPFSGNVRELENMIEQGVALAEGGTMSRDDIVPLDARMMPSERRSRSMQEVVDQAEADAIQSALRQVDGNKERAAEMLGLSPTTLWRKMKRLSIDVPRAS